MKILRKRYDLTNIEISLKGIDNINYISGMFDNCEVLKSISVSDILQSNTNNITDICYLFNNCKNL